MNQGFRMEKILIIEDDVNILMGLEDDLSLEGYQVTSVRDGKEGLKRGCQERFDAIILDLMLPEMNGLQVCQQLRANGVQTPIMILTAKSQEVDKIVGLEIGADDYVTKPFSPRELLARLKALLRRSRSLTNEPSVYRFGNLTFDFETYEAHKAGRPIHLTAFEFALMHLFLKNPNKVLDRDHILNAIWGEQVYVTPRTVDTHIANLRKKIEDDAANPTLLLGIRGVGYKLVLPG